MFKQAIRNTFLINNISYKLESCHHKLQSTEDIKLHTHNESCLLDRTRLAQKIQQALQIKILQVYNIGKTIG